MVPKVLPEIETLKAKLKRGAMMSSGCSQDVLMGLVGLLGLLGLLGVVGLVGLLGFMGLKCLLGLLLKSDLLGGSRGPSGNHESCGSGWDSGPFLAI